MWCGERSEEVLCYARRYDIFDSIDISGVKMLIGLRKVFLHIFMYCKNWCHWSSG